MRVLVTGAEGFIGSHLVEELASSGHTVSAMVKYNSFGDTGWLRTVQEGLLENVELFFADIQDASSFASQLKHSEVVVNLGALISIPYSYRAPTSYVNANILGTLNLLEAMKSDSSKRLIQISTSEVYGTAKYVPIDETHPLNPQSPYAATKVASDALALSYQKSFDMDVVIGRPFNTFGPRQSRRAFIPHVITSFLRSPELLVGNLNPTRDFSFVQDTVRALRKLVEGGDSISGEVFNIGSGFEISMSDVVALVARKMGVPNFVAIESEERVRPENSEVNRLFCSAEKIGSFVDWEPEFGGAAGFSAGLDKTIEWYANPDNLALFEASNFHV